MARQLTLFQTQQIQTLATQKSGLFKRIVQAFKNIKCALTVDDIDTVIRRKDDSDVKKILEAIVEGTLKSHPKLSDVILLFRCVAGAQATYISPIISKAQAQAANPNTNTTSSSTSSVQVCVQATTMTSLSMTSSSSGFMNSTAMTLQALSVGMSSSTTPPIDMQMIQKMMADQAALQERLRQMEEKAKKDEIEKQVLKVQAEKAAADAKAAREKAEKAERKAEATQQAVEQSGISVGGNSAQSFASANATANPVQQQADMAHFVREIVRDEIASTNEAVTHLQEQQDAMTMSNASKKKSDNNGKAAALRASAKKEAEDAKLEQANNSKNPHLQEDREQQRQNEQEMQKKKKVENNAKREALFGARPS